MMIKQLKEANFFSLNDSYKLPISDIFYGFIANFYSLSGN